MVYDYKSIRRTFYVEEIRDRVYAVTFTPEARGKHRWDGGEGFPFLPEDREGHEGDEERAD